MWNGSYWGVRFWATEYWCKVGGIIVSVIVDRRHDDQVDRGGSRSQTSRIGGV